MEDILGVVNVEVCATVISRGVSPRKVVRLHQAVLGVGSYPLPVDLVEVIRLKDQAGDDACALGGPHGDIDLSKEDCGYWLATRVLMRIRDYVGHARYLVEEKVGASVSLAMEKIAPRESSYVTAVLPAAAVNKLLLPLVKSMLTVSEPKADMTGQSGMSHVLEVWAATREDEARATAATEAILVVYILTEVSGCRIMGRIGGTRGPTSLGRLLF